MIRGCLKRKVFKSIIFSGVYLSRAHKTKVIHGSGNQNESFEISSEQHDQTAYMGRLAASQLISQSILYSLVYSLQPNNFTGWRPFCHQSKLETVFKFYMGSSGEMAQQLWVGTALAEDKSLVPSTMWDSSQSTITPALGHSLSVLTSASICTHIYIPTHSLKYTKSSSNEKAPYWFVLLDTVQWST